MGAAGEGSHEVKETKNKILNNYLRGGTRFWTEPELDGIRGTGLRKESPLFLVQRRLVRSKW